MSESWSMAIEPAATRPDPATAVLPIAALGHGSIAGKLVIVPKSAAV